MKPFSQACENNKKPILEVLKKYFATTSRVLEIGSGTGQHAVYFALNLPDLFWQTSDQLPYHQGINLWIESVNSENIGNPLELDVMQADHWNIASGNSGKKFEGVFSANTAHIMPWVAVVEMFRGVGRLLDENGKFILYGPFNSDGAFTSASNERFHKMLLSQNRLMGIRNAEDLFALARDNSLIPVDDVEMPANNRVLVFCRSST
jgi:SAM-dependent methyltransferase